MSQTEQDRTDSAVPPSTPPSADPADPADPADHQAGRRFALPLSALSRFAQSRFALPLSAIGAYAAIRALSLAVAAYLLPRGRFAALHDSLAQLIQAWDSNRYLIIAAHGYSYVPGDLRHDSLFAWFPGYPAAIDAVAWIPGVGAVRGAFAVLIAAGLATACGVARLGVTLTGSRRIGLLMAALWAVAPGSIALSMLYPEALFCALAVWSLIALVERRWLTAALLVALAGTVRSTAMALVLAITLAALAALIKAARARQSPAVWWRPAVALVISPLGLLGYWGFMARAWHRTDAWLWLEHYLHNGFDWGRSFWFDARTAMMAGPSVPSTPLMLTVLVLLAAAVLAAWGLAERVPWYLHVYTLAVVIIAICTGPYYLGSKPRYLLPAMLLGLPLARLLARAKVWVLIPVVAVLAAASTWFSLYLMSTLWAP